MQKISDTIHLIPEEHSTPLPDCNVYVLGTSKEFYLVDTGNGTTAQRKIHSLVQHGFKLTSCRGIICTHSHFDHTNGAAHFDKDVHLHADDIAHLKRDHAGAIYALPAFERFAAQSGLAFNQFRLGKPLHDNDKIAIAGTTWHVIHTPGHTPGSICLYDGKGTLLSGDTLFADSIGRTDFAGSNTQHMIHSLNRIASLRAHTLLPGHERSLHTEQHIQNNINAWLAHLQPRSH